MNGETMTERNVLIQLLELDDEKWGQYALTWDSLWSRLTPEERSAVVLRAQRTGRREAERMVLRLHSRDPEILCGEYGVTVEEEPELNGCGVYLFARFQEPDRVCLYGETIQRVDRFVRETLPERFWCPVRQLVLAHELFHVLESRDPELPTHSMTAPILKLGRHSWRRRLTVPSEIAAMSFSGALLDAPFYPQALDILLMCALGQEGTEARMEGILRTFGGKG